MPAVPKTPVKARSASNPYSSPRTPSGSGSPLTPRRNMGRIVSPGKPGTPIESTLFTNTRYIQCTACLWKLFTSQKALEAHYIGHEAGMNYACQYFYCPELFRTPTEATDHETSCSKRDIEPPLMSLQLDPTSKSKRFQQARETYGAQWAAATSSPHSNNTLQSSGSKPRAIGLGRPSTRPTNTSQPSAQDPSTQPDSQFPHA